MLKTILSSELFGSVKHDVKKDNVQKTLPNKRLKCSGDLFYFNVLNVVSVTVTVSILPVSSSFC